MTLSLRLLVLRLLAPVLLLAASAPAIAIDADDLLPVDRAFALDARATAPGRIELTWKIAEGYYLYRHRMGAAAGAGFDAQPLQLPAGKRKVDEFFGEVETYRGAVTGVLSGTPAAGARVVELKVKYQGCADAGICYPPQQRTLQVALAADAGTGASGGGLAALGRSLGGGHASPALFGGDEPLPEDRAFAVDAIAVDANTLLLRFTPAPGYYLYRDKTTLRLEADGIAAGAPRWPPGRAHRDEHFGDVVVYFEQAEVPVPLRRTHAGAAEAKLVVGFQGCQTDGICYPPMTRTLAVSIPAGAPVPVGAATATHAPAPVPGADAAAPPARASAVPGPAPAPAPDAAPRTAAASAAATSAGNGSVPLAEDTRLAGALAGKDRLWTLLGFFGAGLLLAFTPCVLPMIPILSGLIAGRGERIGARQAFALSFVYVLANALVFTAAGVIAGLVGANLQVAFQVPWVIVAFAALFMVLSLSMFGLYELQLPAAFRARLGALSDRQHGGSWAGVAAMGALSALIVGPCVAPPLAAAVLYIGQARDPVLGGAALFLLAMGMGAPLLAFGVAAGRGLPTSGPWMVGVQRVFGFVFLGLAVWMLSRLLAPAWTLALYGLVALAAAAWALSAAHTPRGRLQARFAALVLGIVGAAQLVGALSGGRDPLQPLAGLRGVEQRHLEFRRIKSVADLDREVAAARTAGRPLLFDFYADWCVACKEMEKYTFTDPAVHAALADFVLLKADVTANDAVDQALMRRFGIVGPPATLFFRDGAELRGLRLYGFEDPAPFAGRAGRARP
jgi:thiol:disulfide interchange protein DsbD